MALICSFAQSCERLIFVTKGTLCYGRLAGQVERVGHGRSLRAIHPFRLCDLSARMYKQTACSARIVSAELSPVLRVWSPFSSA